MRPGWEGVEERVCLGSRGKERSRSVRSDSVGWARGATGSLYVELEVVALCGGAPSWVSRAPTVPQGVYLFKSGPGCFPASELPPWSYRTGISEEQAIVLSVSG